MPIPLSVLDVSPVPAGTSSAQALRNTLDLARLADRLGYTRYWLAEHHNIPSIASSAPEIMIGHVAGVTARLRVGSGGIMLPNHTPLKVVETFRVLAALHPDRIDLGLGRAPGTDQLTALALRRSREALAAQDFDDQLLELLAFATGEWPDNHPFRAVQAVPADVPLPPIWLLSSSGHSAGLAAELGVGFAFAYHINPNGGVVEAMLAYRQQFSPSRNFPQPHAMLTVSVICAGTEGEAADLATTLELAFLRLSSGRPAPLPSPAEAKAYPYTPAERAHIEASRGRFIVGTPETVRTQLLQMAAQTQADEIMVTTMTYDHAARLHSYELLAEAFELQAAAAAPG
jgi:luciferase family oxidoreductase group 1